MKKQLIFLVGILSLSLVAFGQTKGLFDFVAPVVFNHDDTDITKMSDIGTIVYDAETDQFYGKASNNTWQEITSGGSLAVKTTLIQERKTSGTAGGSSTSGTWHTRALSHQYGDTSFASLASNQFTLAAGTYEVEANATVRNANITRLKIYNVTDLTDQVFGTSLFVNGSQTDSHYGQADLYGIITITSQKTFELRHYTQSGFAGSGLGVASSLGEEVYSQVKITKLD